MKKIITVFLLLFVNFSHGNSLIKLDCDFLKPEFRGGNFKYRADVVINLIGKKVNLSIENNLGAVSTDWSISKVTDEYIFATRMSPNNEELLLVIDRYKSLLILPPDGKYGECKSISKKF